MYKKIVLICFVLLLCGCKKLEDSTNYVGFVNDCLKDKTLTNRVALGYQYYVPRGVKMEHDYDYNQIFLVDGSYLYLYVDIISYYYQKDLQNIELGEDFYYESIQFKDKKGYIKINKIDDKYFLSILYHYSKIEVYTTYEKLNEMITISSIILNSIEYNDTVIKKILDGDLGEFSEFTYEVDKPEGAISNFSQYLEEFVQKEEKKEEELPDE